MAVTQAIDLSSLAPGQTVGTAQHRFVLQNKAGDSLFGQLWRAQDLSVQGHPEVTLEFIRPELVNDSQTLEALKRAVTVGKKLRHKHLTVLHGFFHSASQPVFIAAEPLDGATLADLLREGKTRTLSDNQLKGLLLQVATALDTAFGAQQACHGSLCPANIHINRGSGIKLTGFATFALHPALPKERHHTQHAEIYQAPETHHGRKHNRAADVFSLACISYEVLTGHPPFATTREPAQCDPLRLSQPKQLSEQQWRRLQAALSSEPSARPANALSLIRGLFQADDDRIETVAEAAPQELPATPPLEAKDRSPVRLSETDLVQDDMHAARNTPATKATMRQGRAKPGLAPLLTFVVGVAVGYGLSLWLTPAVQGPNAIEKSNPQATMNAPVTEPQDAAETTVSEKSHSKTVQSAVSNAGVESDTKALTDDTASFIAAAQLTETQAPRTLLFRDQIRSELYGPDMVALPAGQFMMGDHHKLGDDNEYPVHRVTIRQPFALSRYEVTFAQYDTFAQATRRALPADEGWGRGNRPVINVSWQDAQAYADWLSKQTGQPYRLPSEAEWEYAARAGSNTAFSWGSEPRSGFAVCDECGSDWDGSQSAPVGSLQANAWGLYDMAGNVSEWVADCYAPDYSDAPDSGAAYRSDNCSERAMRGGSWFDIMRLMRPAARYRHPANASQNDWGFRVALDLPEAFNKENNE